MKIMLTCKESVDLMVAAEDRPLTRGERAALRMHLWMCTRCPTFLGQMPGARESSRLGTLSSANAISWFVAAHQRAALACR